jgi:hypothetical protein
LRESRKAWVASADIWRWRRLTWAKAAVQAILSPTHTAGRAEYDMPSDPCPAQTACFEGVLARSTPESQTNFSPA